MVTALVMVPEFELTVWSDTIDVEVLPRTSPFEAMDWLVCVRVSWLGSGVPDARGTLDTDVMPLG